MVIIRKTLTKIRQSISHKWNLKSAFAVHTDFNSHTGGVMTMVKFGVQTVFHKHKLNTNSSTQSEFVGEYCSSVIIICTKLFIEVQGYVVDKNLLYQYNKITILLELNGKGSYGKRTRALNMRYFFQSDQTVSKIEYKILSYQ